MKCTGCLALLEALQQPCFRNWQNWPSSLPWVSSICPVGRRLHSQRRRRALTTLFPAARSLPALFSGQTDNSGQKLPFLSQSVQRAVWAWNIECDYDGKSSKARRLLDCAAVRTAAAWRGKSRAMGYLSPEGSGTFHGQHPPTDLGQWLCWGVTFTERNENFWPPEHSVRQFFLSQGNCWGSKHYYGWRRWENEKWGQGRRMYCLNGNFLIYHVSFPISASRIQSGSV